MNSNDWLNLSAEQIEKLTATLRVHNKGPFRLVNVEVNKVTVAFKSGGNNLTVRV